MWLGYVSFGYLATAFGRKRVYVLSAAAAALLVLFAGVRSPWLLLVLAPCLAFAATGYFSGFAAVTAEMYPTRIRSTGQGFTYNLGRLASAAAPYAVGALAERHGFGAAFHLDAAAFLVRGVAVQHDAAYQPQCCARVADEFCRLGGECGGERERAFYRLDEVALLAQDELP